MERAHLLTEQRLAASMNLDTMPLEQAIDLMNAEDAGAVAAVAAEKPNVQRAIELIVPALRHGGRLFYVGAGTSGRLGLLDAAECPPTFRTPPELVQGIMAGGNEAMFKAKEGVEDQTEAGAAAINAHRVRQGDVVLGIAAGGTTPFVHGALRRARDIGAGTIFLSCVQPVANEPVADVIIRPLTGPEVLTGSTRLKAGTATKLVLNTLSTLSMVQLGKVYQNLMVDLSATNSKLWDRGARILSTLTGLSSLEAMDLLKRAGGHVKLAIVMWHTQGEMAAAQRLLEVHSGNLRAALGHRG